MKSSLQLKAENDSFQQTKKIITGKQIKTAQQFIKTQKSLGIDSVQQVHFNEGVLISGRDIHTNQSLKSKSRIQLERDQFTQSQEKIRMNIKPLSKLTSKLSSKLSSGSHLKEITQDHQPINLQQEKEIIKKNPQKSFINFIASKQFFTGRISFIWLFILKNPSIELKNKLSQIYKPFILKSYTIPLCRTIEEGLVYLRCSKLTYFKIVMDLQNGQNFIKYINNKNHQDDIKERQQIQKKIKFIYIYNSQKINGIKRAINIKQSYPQKIKGMLLDIQGLLINVSSEIQNGNKFFLHTLNSQNKSLSEMKQVRCASKLPGFIKLSNQDKTEITNYRQNLYTAIKLTDKKQRQQKLMCFKQFVSKVYQNDQKQFQNLNTYLNSIDHIKISQIQQQNYEKYFKTLRFYVQETFYYKVLNNLLRFSRTIQQFIPITLPFNQTYKAIKYFYDIKLKQNNSLVSNLKLYRGVPVIEKDLQTLKQGNFIQLLGFVSTSKNQQYAIDHFIKKNGDYLFIIQIKQRKALDNIKKYDHGFVILSDFNIATSEYTVEEQVLINTLNIFKINKVILQDQSEDGIGRVYMQYAPVFQIIQKNIYSEYDLTQQEKQVMQNYKYCMKLMDQIEDRGDLYMKSQQYDKCKQYYYHKIQQQGNKLKNKKNIYNKIAQAQYKSGRTDQARINALKSMQQYQNQYEIQISKGGKFDKQKCLRIFQLHQSNFKILKQQQDTLMAKKALNNQLNFIQKIKINNLDQVDTLILKIQTIYEKACLQFKESDMNESKKDLQSVIKIVEEFKNQLQKRQNKIKIVYSLKQFYNRFCCFSKINNQLQIKRQNQIKQIQKIKQKLLENKNKIDETLSKINLKLCQIYQFSGDRTNQLKYAQKAKNILEQTKQKHITRENNSFTEAKFKVLQAKIQNSLNKKQNITKSQSLLEQAINTIKIIQPLHKDLGDYQAILGKFKQKQFNKNLILPKVELQEEQNNIQRQIFSYQEQQTYYKQIKQTYKQSLNVLNYHYTQDHPKVFEVRNNIGNIQYVYSQYKQSYQQAQIILSTSNGPKHTQGAKAALLLAKIHLAKGQIKISFSYIQRSNQILKCSLIKQSSNPQYFKLYLNSPIFIQIQIYKCKVYNKQLKHDLSLKSLNQIQKITKNKLKSFNVNQCGYLADIYEEYGNSYIGKNDVERFQKYYQKAIQIRQNQMGKINIPNAISLCTMFKYLLFSLDIENAQKYLNDSFIIFSHFSLDHPNFWVQHVSMAYLSQKNNDITNYMNQLSLSLKLLQKRYSSSHISYLKMKAKYANLLTKNSDYQNALHLLQDLQKQLQQDITLSQKQIKCENQTQDQKIGIKKYVDQSLRLTVNGIQKLKISKTETKSKKVIVSPQRRVKFNLTKAFDEQSKQNLLVKTIGNNSQMGKTV